MNVVDEEKLIERLVPKIEERIRYRIVRSIIKVLEEEFYPPEEMFREEFIESVKEAESEIKEGKSKIYSYEEFKKIFS